MLERRYQADLIRRIKKRFPHSIVLKNDTGYMQGIPDLLVLVGPFWAMLEVKPSLDADFEPNQEWYLEKLSWMGGFAAVICPENEEGVLNDLQSALSTSRRDRPRISER